jgi:hypothetical protein
MMKLSELVESRKQPVPITTIEELRDELAKAIVREYVALALAILRGVVRRRGFND